jgi:hypothetical protein
VFENACQKKAPESQSESQKTLHLLQEAYSRKNSDNEIADYS